MILNYELQINSDSKNTPIVFIHGLFGSLSNLGMLARAFMKTHTVLQLDVRNHGKSGHSAEMNYGLMAQDIVETLDQIGLPQVSLVGHSMGGKIAMRTAHLAPERIESLAILDVAPFAYQQNHHDQIFKALIAVEQEKPQTRQQAIEIMKKFVADEMVIQFLLKSFSKGQWLFNVQALYKHYADILSWEEQPAWLKPALFLRGTASPYIGKPEYLEAISRQFPLAEIQDIQDAGHWLHAEKTAEVLEQLHRYLNN
ncbi:alpha/beta fold hydrolase [Acinetobacter pragensis]|uniref:Acyl-CoA esterase n=1 Tax=Acinetobacter pragensis TaxID=1806892 RepID=A0A151XYT9_9GAMM|nr:alpha/beta fold hydrolase [Acinetobacter pragensis]KYQ70947.1 acyl-CoA esterase [Acinetobacter pragensis]